MGVIKSKVGRCAFASKSGVIVLSLGFWLFPNQVMANSADTQFKQYLVNICTAYPVPPGWTLTGQNCLDAFAGQPISGTAAVTVSTNLSVNAASGSASRKNKGIRELRDEQKEETEKGASADGSSWGFLLTPQFGNSNRNETDLENGYQSKLIGLVAGLDYRYSNSFVFGATLGYTKDNATFLNSAGFIKTSSNALTMYSTWLPSESVSVDGYLGYGKLNFDSNRHVEFGLISGTTSGTTNGHQVMAGISTSYQKDVGRLNLSPFINLDYIKTFIDGYRESGTTSLEMHYFDRSTISMTTSLGARLSTSYGYDWGTLNPTARLATVHEFQNNSKQITNELVGTPGYGFTVTTDAPDRNYLDLGLGVSAALNGGTQLFLDYDRRAQDKLLSSWAVSLGALMEF
ncbi:MAG: autotransporter outer membrane beta-barrel domain-containing protein [Gammaproteobacteria bacterium]|nr:autotransporter outer membrane beta-barrel domain-containing protein [Gammaproteobacteria bacterium]